MYLGTTPRNNSSPRNNKCKICNDEVKYFKSHLKITHKMTQKEYDSLFSEEAEPSEHVESEKNFDKVSKPTKDDDCKLCNEKVKYSKPHLKNVHKINEKEYDLLISNQPGPSGIQNSTKKGELVANNNRACKVCNEKVKNFKSHLKDAHEMTEKDYDLIFMLETQNSSMEDEKNIQNERKSDEPKASRPTRSLSRKTKKNNIEKSGPVATTQITDSEVIVNEDEHIKGNNIEGKLKKNNTKKSGPVTTSQITDSEVIVNEGEHIKENNIERKTKKNNNKKSGPVTNTQITDSEVIVNEDEHIKENNIEDIVETFPPRKFPLSEDELDEMKKDMPASQQNEISEIDPDETQLPADNQDETIFETPNLEEIQNHSKDVSDKTESIKKDIIDENNIIKSGPVTTTQVIDSEVIVDEEEHIKENNMEDISDKTESIKKDITDENNLPQFETVTQSKTQKFAFKFTQKAVEEKPTQDTKLVDSQENKSQDKKSKCRISFFKSGRLVPSTERKSAEGCLNISSQANLERKRRCSLGMG